MKTNKNVTLCRKINIKVIIKIVFIFRVFGLGAGVGIVEIGGYLNV